MAGYVCTVAGGKGGVGKTTTAVNVGAALQELGHDVVVVDADLGMANLGAMLDVDPDHTVHDVLADEAPVGDALADVDGGLTVIAGDRQLEAFGDAEPKNLEPVVETLRNAFDVVLLDTGTGLRRDVAVPLGLADGVVLVTTPDDISLRDTRKTEQLTDRIDGRVVGVLLNRVTPGTDVSAIDEHFTAEVVAVVPEDIVATSSEPLVVDAPESAAAGAFGRAAETLGMLAFDPDIDGDDVIVTVDDEWFSDRADADRDAESSESDGASADDPNGVDSDDDSSEGGGDDSGVNYSMGWR